MRTFKYLNIVFLFIVILLSSCREDMVNSEEFPPKVTEPEILVNGSFSGIIFDQQNEAIENATVGFGDEERMTDDNGFFNFDNVNINTKGSLVTAEKDGYFYNAKFVKSKANTDNFIKIKMIKKNLTGSFQASQGSEISTVDGARITFEPNSIMLEDGGIYTGSVNVYATWLNPVASDLTSIMPGDLRAINSDEELQQLTTYGMIGVELEGDNGQKLNISTGSSARITMPVPQEIRSSAPNTIPLWHFDEMTGYWEEEGSATLEGGNYVGDVSHFSFWNCDLANDFINIEGVVLGPEGTPLAN